MRGPTRSASVIAAPPAAGCGLAERNRQRSVLQGALATRRHEASRSTAAIAASTALVGNARLPELGDQALHGETIHRVRRSAQADSNCAVSLRRVASWVRSRCSGVTEIQP